MLNPHKLGIHKILKNIPDPEMSPPTTTTASSNDDGQCDDGVPLKEDPAYSKYFRMLTTGLPKGAVINSMARSGVDDSILDLDPDKSLASQIAPVATTAPKSTATTGARSSEDYGVSD
mmetsp:Transcript_33000/g.37539  ORF Transcript_33000/g.37539 Transcript_33000/m.37539 type:complete len:118 (+) Transcript_33000:220-573(+)|eukprot:CAMPEP_0194152228 /NCGR_PEP_ID=MMETSP0152-20130528/51440_1 /TAXON_ID=1049557 /ORGANISM="Thalassiothrix antarctica, Strain L6-D1" /LENGTH=117 /DNA_ID=CAMNT_0038856589 /DNA_START=221 /DNA_END=574 /DNA_ORIENTATION=+